MLAKGKEDVLSEGTYCHKVQQSQAAHKKAQQVASKAAKEVERLDEQLAKAKTHKTASDEKVATAAQEVLETRRAYDQAYPDPRRSGRGMEDIDAGIRAEEEEQLS